MELELIIDGGMVGRNPGGVLYSSYKFGDVHEKVNHGVAGTSNEGEYLAIIEGIYAIVQHYGCAQGIDLVVYTDSQLVRNQATGRWRVRAENLKWLCYVAQMLLGSFGSFRVEWVPRKEIVAELGH